MCLLPDRSEVMSGAFSSGLAHITNLYQVAGQIVFERTPPAGSVPKLVLPAESMTGLVPELPISSKVLDRSTVPTADSLECIVASRKVSKKNPKNPHEDTVTLQYLCLVNKKLRFLRHNAVPVPLALYAFWKKRKEGGTPAWIARDDWARTFTGGCKSLTKTAFAIASEFPDGGW